MKPMAILPRLKCHLCDKPGAWQTRIGIPDKAGELKYLITNHVFCLEHRKSGVKAASLLDAECLDFITSRMKQPDIAGAYLEWATL